ncbi:MAG: hypothetical protein ABI822_28760 [Bryobacteraceae bacterium]
MAKRRKISAQTTGVVSVMKAESKALGYQIAELTGRKLKLDEAIASFEGPPPKKLRGFALTRYAAVPKSSPFYGMNLPQAVAKQLSTHTTPQLPTELWAEMEGKFPSRSKDPAHAVRWALNRRADSEGDVMLFGEGKWAMTAWYTEEDRKKIKASLGKMSGRDREAHIAKTRAGALALKDRGVTLGRKLKLTPDVTAKFRKLIEGGMSLSDACQEIGIAESTYWANRKKWPGLKIPKKRRASQHEAHERDLLSEAEVPEVVN